MYYPQNIFDVKEQLTIRAIDLYNTQKALKHLISTLVSYKRKNLDKYFIDALAASSPKRTKHSTRWNSQTRKDEPYTYKLDLYRGRIEKSYFNKFVLYIEPTEELDFYLPTRSEDFLFSTALNEPFSPPALLERAEKRLEVVIDTQNKINHDRANIETLVKSYDEARQTLEAVENSMHYYTKDFISGNNSYSVQKFIK